jgi:esterase/lipase superfamily enzyme
VTLQHVGVYKNEPAMFDAINGAVGKAGVKEALVFIHGYNVTFEDASKRAAQLALDLDLPACILYSWASKGNAVNYMADSNDVETTVDRLQGFLDEVRRSTHADRIHIIAHSMGNRALLRAMQILALRYASGGGPRFNQVILAAPDIGVTQFRQLADAVVGRSDRVTLYASSRDRALQASKSALVNAEQRAGDSVPSLVIIPGIDSVDVSLVDTDFLGHGAYAKQRSLLNDIFDLLRYGVGPSQRFGFTPFGEGWRLEK